MAPEVTVHQISAQRAAQRWTAYVRELGAVVERAKLHVMPGAHEVESRRNLPSALYLIMPSGYM